LDIEVLYFAEFKDITGKDSEKFNLSNPGILDLVNLLFEKYNSIKNLIWDENLNRLKLDVSIAINNEITSKKDDLTSELSNGDKIAFLLPISGG